MGNPPGPTSRLAGDDRLYRGAAARAVRRVGPGARGACRRSEFRRRFARERLPHWVEPYLRELMATSAAAVDRVTPPRPDGSSVCVRLSGRFTLEGGLPTVEPVVRAIESGAERLTFDAAAVEDWDSALVTFVHSVAAFAHARNLRVDTRRPSGGGPPPRRARAGGEARRDGRRGRGRRAHRPGRPRRPRAPGTRPGDAIELPGRGRSSPSAPSCVAGPASGAST